MNAGGGSSGESRPRADGVRTPSASGCTSAGRDGGTANSSVSMNLEKPGRIRWNRQRGFKEEAPRPEHIAYISLVS